MKKILTITLLTSSVVFASSFSVDSIGLNVGKANSDYKQINHQGSIDLGNTPDERFDSYEIYTTLKNEIYGMKPYISYTYSKNTDIKHSYILTGLNRYYKTKSIKPYAGVLLGYGELKYKYDPINNSKDNNNDANSFIVGMQLGLEFPITKQILVGIDGKYLVHKYETTLKPSNTALSTLEHKHTSNISIGLKYSF